MLKFKDISFIFTIFVVILSLEVWSFVPVEKYQYILNLLAIGLILLGLVMLPTKRTKIDLNYKNIILWMILLRLLSTITCYIFHNQSILYTLAVERTLLLWLFYFFLHKSGISPSVLMRIVILVASIWAILTILQQLTYPLYAFTNRENADTGEVPYRAGVYRFMIRGFQYGIFIGLMYFSKFISSKDKKYILGYLLFFIAIYFHSARQFIASYIIASLSLIFFLKGRKKYIALAVIAFFLSILYFTYDIIFSEYISQSQEDLTENNIRLVAMFFFGETYFPHWLCNLFGNGAPYSQSQYGIEYFQDVNESLGLFRTDIGIIGSYNLYGIFYALLVVYSLLKVFFLKLASKYVYCKLFAVSVLAFIILVDTSYSNYAIPFFCIYFYLIDCYVSEYKKASYSDSSL